MAEIVEFKPAAPEPSDDFPATVKRRDYVNDCQHPHPYLVDESARSISCQKCETVLDPVAVVLAWSRAWDRKRWDLARDQKLDRMVVDWHGAGGRIVIRPSGVVVEMKGERWASSCGGGTLAQLNSALERASGDLSWRKDKSKLTETARGTST